VIAVKTAIGQACRLRRIRSAVSKPSDGRQATIGVGIVHIFEAVGKAYPDTAREACERIGEGVGAGPAHLLENGRHMAGVTRADKPEPTILGRTENEVVMAKEAESLGDVTGIQRRDIGTDENCRTRGTGSERAAHADSEIALALVESLDPNAPMTGAMAGLIRRHRDPQPPTPVLGEAAQQERDHRALEAQRREIADVPREAALAAPEKRRSHEQNESAPHQP
jgi:hypothetical protein